MLDELGRHDVISHVGLALVEDLFDPAVNQVLVGIAHFDPPSLGRKACPPDLLCVTAFLPARRRHRVHGLRNHRQGHARRPARAQLRTDRLGWKPALVRRIPIDVSVSDRPAQRSQQPPGQLTRCRLGESVVIRYLRGREISPPARTPAAPGEPTLRQCLAGKRSLSVVTRRVNWRSWLSATQA